MDLVGVFKALGREPCVKLVRSVSIGALRTFGVYEAIKIRSRLRTLNRQKLRTVAPKLWIRIADGDTDLAHALSQAILVSNIPLITGVLDFLKIEHDGNGFYSKDADHAENLRPGWADAVLERFGDRYPRELVLLYINYLGWETATLDEVFAGAGAEAAGEAD